MTDPRITEIDRKLKIARSLTVANVSKSLKHVPKSVIKRSLERVKSYLITKLTTEKMELLVPRTVFTRTPRRRVSSTRSTSLPKRNSQATTLVNTLVNSKSKM